PPRPPPARGVSAHLSGHRRLVGHRQEPPEPRIGTAAAALCRWVREGLATSGPRPHAGRPMTATVVGSAVLSEHAARIRAHIADICAGSEGGRLGGSLSLVEILTALYFSVLRVDPAWPDDPERDVFLLSKGHAAVGLDATLAAPRFMSPRDV